MCAFPATAEAVVICTRNRPEDLKTTLQSVATQSGATKRTVVVVDGSDPPLASETAVVVEHWSDRRPFYYHRYPKRPAGTRQRNTGVDLLPSSVEIVHFIDDDVTLKPGYFQTLSATFQHFPSLVGVGGIIEPENGSPRRAKSLLHRLFLLSSSRPSRVLPSGQTTPAWSIANRAVQPAEWLSTCASSYRRDVFDHHRLDPTVEGPSPRFEDLDFSYRVAQDGPLAIATDARCIHHVSSTLRRSLFETARESVVRRYWFVEKNLSTNLHRLAFWWSMCGRLLILILSLNPNSWTVLQGVLQGLQAVVHRQHELLSKNDNSADMDSSSQ